MAQSYGLGRGLYSLIPPKNKKNNPSNTSPFAPSDFVHKSNDINLDKEEDYQKSGLNEGQKAIKEIAIDKIVANPHQPRLEFDKEKLRELSQSIKEHGIIQPLVVVQAGDKYELVAGERRWRAAQLAGLKKVPVLVREAAENEKEKLELAVIENIQRHDLNPLEEAKAYKKLMTEFGLSQKEVAQKMSKSRSAVANKIRLLSLPIEAQKALLENKINEGHAKVILSLENAEKQRMLLDLILNRNLTVRQAEDQVRRVTVKTHTRKIDIDPEIQALEERLNNFLGTKVKIRKSRQGGKIEINYYSEDEFNSIIKNILGNEE